MPFLERCASLLSPSTRKVRIADVDVDVLPVATDALKGVTDHHRKARQLRAADPDPALLALTKVGEPSS